MSPVFTPRFKSVLLIALIALFLLQRSGLLLYGFSHIAYPGFDETASGVFTCDLLDNQKRAPLFVYQYESRSGDSLLEGFLLLPFFKLFGRSLFSLKLFALCSAFLSLVCWIILLKRYQGMGSALIFAALFAFPPPMFARLNLLGSIASHHLINPLLAVQILLLFRIIERSNPTKPSLLWFGLGLAAGLGSYTFYTYLIFNAYCFLFLMFTKPRLFTSRAIIPFGTGLLGGFSPWFIRMIYSPTGGNYLATILKNVDFNPWTVLQNFGFNVPHSLGYSYPSRALGIVSPLFYLFVLFMGAVIVKHFYSTFIPNTSSLKSPNTTRSPAILLSIFLVLFPLFFLGCLSLSPMKISLFEYWPTIGFFGNFSVADVYRYRWLHPLFPFYFAIIAVGISFFLQSSSPRRVSFASVLLLLIFFLLWGLGRSAFLLSKDDFGKVFFYKGYNYDQMGNRFILSNMIPFKQESALQFAKDYPAENRREAYRCLGTKVALEAGKDPQEVAKIEKMIATIGPSYRDDFIFGIVRAQQKLTPKEFQPIKDLLTERHAEIFYEQWGFRTLGYQYYDFFLNRKKVITEIPPLERWIFKKDLERFNAHLSGHDPPLNWDTLLEKIKTIPIRYQEEAIRGLGKLIGAEMLFDPMATLDYPLNGGLGEHITDATLRNAFFEGVGAGFAETLSRLWRTLLLPGDPADPRYATRLDMEWTRCQSLIDQVPKLNTPLVVRGFNQELEKQPFDEGIQTYLRMREKHPKN